jgi:hypothetical protein
MNITRRDISFLDKIMDEHGYNENSSEIITNDEYRNVKFEFNHQISSLFDTNTLINIEFQVFTSFILCILSFIGVLFHTGILLRQYFHTKSFSHRIFIQSLFDSCHLMNILFTHIIVYMKTSTNFNCHCPLSIFFFSLISFGSISFLCLEAFHRYMYLSKTRSIRHRLLAHQFILITSISWLIFNFPKFDFSSIYYFSFSSELTF